MATRSGPIPGSPPKSVPGAPSRISGAPLSVPGGPPRQVGGLFTRVPDLSSATSFREVHTQQLRNLEGRYAGTWGVSWTGMVATGENMNRYIERVGRARQEAMKQLADDMVAYAQENHPWENDTGDAENLLQAAVIDNEDKDTTVVWLAHGVPYGIWLEVMQGGRFAILLPTVYKFAPEIAGRIASYV